MTEKRKRSANWVPSEKELLYSLVKIHYNIVENKKTDGVTMKTKQAQWDIIADQYNNRTTNCSRTGQNLKGQWENMKKIARREAAKRKYMSQTGGGSTIPTREDLFMQKIFHLISTSALKPNNSDSIIPPVQEQTTQDVIEPPSIQYVDIPISSVDDDDDDDVIDQCSMFDGTVDEDITFDSQVLSSKKDWGNYMSQLLKTPSSQDHRNDDQPQPINKKRHKKVSSFLEQLHKKKVEAIELQKRLALEEMERSKVIHGLDIKIKNEILKQEKIKSNLLMIRRRRLLQKIS